MRELKPSDKNVLKINDARSGSQIELYYRNPATHEEAAYQAKLIKRRGNKVVLNSQETRLTFGLKILTGFKDGDFAYDGKPVSSDPSSPIYREDWKEIVSNGAGDMVALLAMTVFEGARAANNDDMEIEVEEPAPLERS